MSKYTILRTDKAEEQLRDIIFYLAEVTDVDNALAYLDRIEKMINNLQEFPCLGVVPRYPILRKQGYRVLVVETNLIFYKVDEKNERIIIYAIVDSRSEYLKLI